MQEHKEIVYPEVEENIGDPSLKLDGEYEEKYGVNVMEIISSYTGVNKEKLEYFINNFSLARIIDQPQIIGLSPEQENKFKELKFLLHLEE